MNPSWRSWRAAKLGVMLKLLEGTGIAAAQSNDERFLTLGPPLRFLVGAALRL